MSRGVGGHQSARMGSAVWLTPPHVLAELGSFDLDPCAAPEPRPWATAARHYAEDGLELPWDGRVWLNPPYGGPKIIGPWMRRMAAHGWGTAIIFARTETEVFFETVWRRAHACLFLEGRLYFHRGDGRRAKFNGGAPSVLVAYGAEDMDRLAAADLAGAFVPLRLDRGHVVAALGGSWVELVEAFVGARSGPVAVSDLYRHFARHPKARGRAHYREKLRQTLQRGPFRRVGRGLWEKAS